MSSLFGIKIPTPQVTFRKRKKNRFHTLGIGVFKRLTKNVGSGFWKCFKAVKDTALCATKFVSVVVCDLEADRRTTICTHRHPETETKSHQEAVLTSG